MTRGIQFDRKHRRVHWNWRITLVRLLVNGVSVILTALVIPGIGLVGDRPVINFLIVGVVLGLLNAIIRPIVQFVTLPFIFVSYGVAIVAVNTVMFIILAWLLPDIIVVNGLIAAILGGVVLGLLSLVLENISGATPPLVDSQ